MIIKIFTCNFFLFLTLFLEVSHAQDQHEEFLWSVSFPSCENLEEKKIHQLELFKVLLQNKGSISFETIVFYEKGGVSMYHLKNQDGAVFFQIVESFKGVGKLRHQAVSKLLKKPPKYYKLPKTTPGIKQRK